MGLFNKFLKKSDKSTNRLPRDKEVKKVKEEIEKKPEFKEPKKEPTIHELKEKAVKTDKTGKAETKKTVKEVIKNGDTKEAYRIFVKPMVTEKGTYLASQNKYIFEVTPAANKIEIKKAIKAVYGVDPIKVNIVSLTGKQIRYGRTRGRTKDRKKAVVTLPEGQTIEVYEGV